MAKARFQQYALLYTLAVAVFWAELAMEFATSRKIALDQLVLMGLVLGCHLVKRRPKKSIFRPHRTVLISAGQSAVKSQSNNDVTPASNPVLSSPSS